MQQRLSSFENAQGAINAMLGITKYLSKSKIEPQLLHLIDLIHVVFGITLPEKTEKLFLVIQIDPFAATQGFFQIFNYLILATSYRKIPAE